MQGLTLGLQLGRQMVSKLAQQGVVRIQLVLPRARLHCLNLAELAGRKPFQPVPYQVFKPRHDAERRLDALRVLVTPPDDPRQHAHVLGKARPDELPVRVAAKPVDPEDLRRMVHRLAHLQPVREVVTHVVATEGDHRHRVAPHDPNLARDRRRGLGTKRGTHVDRILPGRRLDDQGYG